MTKHHATYEKFGGDETLIAPYRHWSVLARPKQATLGAMVLVAHADVTSYGELPAEAHAELAEIIPDLEAAANAVLSPDKMNYLMLMMVDPHVHFHVLPRYAQASERLGAMTQDPGWPGPPDLKASVGDDDVAARVRDALRDAWPTR